MPRYYLNIDPVFDDLYFMPTIYSQIVLLFLIMIIAIMPIAWVIVFRIIPEFRILRLIENQPKNAE